MTDSNQIPANVQLRHIPRHEYSGSADLIRPWEFKPSVPVEVQSDKLAFSQWAESPDTEHCFYTGWEGLSAGQRMAGTNLPYSLRGVVADYDVRGSTIDLDQFCQNIRGELPQYLWPTFVHGTMRRGARAVWLLAAPMPVGEKPIVDALTERLYRKLKLNNLAQGFDRGAWDQPSHVFDVGTDWRRLGGLLHEDIVLTLCVEAAEIVARSKISLDGTMIPLDDAIAEIERRWPGRWTGGNTVGCRSIVPWNPNAANPTTAVLYPNGIYAFGQPVPWNSWEYLFGRPFVEKYTDDKIGQAVKGIHRCGRNYWMKADEKWRDFTHEDIVRELKLIGLSHRAKGGAATEIDRALGFIGKRQRVDSVASVLWDPRETIEAGDHVTLNISTAKPMMPVDEPQEWGVNFPWLASVFEGLLGAEQDEQFQHWHHYFYDGAYKQDPNKGHALFFVGPVHSGKSLIAKILGMIYGGSADVSRYMLDGDNFNEEMAAKAIWLVDDATAAQSDVKTELFTQRLKQHVVNENFTVRAMYRSGSGLPLMGRRIVVCLNDDAESIRMLPSLGSSLGDKVMYFKVKKPSNFGSYRENEEKLRRELPYYLRWLLDMKANPALLETKDKRLWVKRYVHPELTIDSLVSSGAATVLSILNSWFEHRRTEDKNTSDVWTGKSGDLFSSIDRNELLHPQLRGINVTSFGRRIGLLARTFPKRFQRGEDTYKTAVWRIYAPWVDEATIVEGMGPTEHTVGAAVSFENVPA